MNAKLLARAGAAALVGMALTLAVVQLREERGEPDSRVSPSWVPDGDPLALQLRACAQMGELALSSADCRSAWAEKRRRFFGVDHPDTYRAIDPADPKGSATRELPRTQGSR